MNSCNLSGAHFSLFQKYCGFHVTLQKMISKLTYTQNFQIYDYKFHFRAPISSSIL